jgi:hypothetical protein
VVLVRPAGVVPDGVDRERDIGAARPGERLAVVERLERGEVVRALLHEVREAVQELAALRAGRLQAPLGLERVPSDLDGAVDVRGRALGHFADDLAVGWSARISIAGCLENVEGVLGLMTLEGGGSRLVRTGNERGEMNVGRTRSSCPLRRRPTCHQCRGRWGHSLCP